ncbi:MAG: response regulator [Cyanobacteriota bacterium]
MDKPTIVCVDDERLVLVSLRDQLAHHLGNEYSIELAQSGEEALEIFEELREEEIDIPLIISDQIMPGMKGDELLVKIHADYPKTLKILLTGQASADAVGHAVNCANLYRYIAKPWDKTDLCLTVSEALRSYAQDKQLAEQNEALQKINTELALLNTSLEKKVADRTAELATAEAELRGIFAAMTELIFVLDNQGRYLKIVSNNPELLDHPENWLGKTLHEIFAPEQADTFWSYIQNVIETQQTVSVEYSLTMGQHNFWFAANISPISDHLVIWVARDITARQLLEEKLRRSEEKIRAIFESMTDIVLVINAQREIEVAPTHLNRWHNSETDLISLTIEQFFIEEKSEICWGKVQQVLETQQTANFDYNLWVEGKELWFSASIAPMPNNSVIWVARDISELYEELHLRHQTEVALRQSEEKFASAFRSSPSAITITRLSDGCHVEVNDSFCQFTGYTREEIIDRTALELNLWVDLNARNHLFQTLLARGTVRNYEFEFRTQPGDIKTALLSAELINLNGQTCVISVSQDISDRKQTEAAMWEAKEAAEAANRAKSTFLATMSHELRSPLNAILGFSQLLTRSRSLNPEQQESVSIIKRSGEHLLTLINNVLDLSKIEAGRTPLNEQNFDLYRLLDDLEDMFYLRAQEKHLQLICDRAFDVPQFVRTDEVKLRQILINLLNNAIKFTQVGSVSVRVDRKFSVGTLESWNIEESNLPTCQPTNLQPVTLTIEVSDTGIGIPPEELESIFEAFVQTKIGKASPEGTGLGLAITRQFVRLMGGDITASSQLGRGSTFKFNIPIRVVDAINIEVNKQPTRRIIALEPNQPFYRILIVDDRWENRHLLLKMLQPLGFELQEASNGIEAVEIWESWQPHLIWMDMRMPVMDGYEATQKIKATTKGQAIAVIALTASILEEERAVVLSTGCDDFVRKPFREADIFDTMSKHLGVRYIYDESPELDASHQKEAEIQNALTSKGVAALPLDLLTELKQAATCIDMQKVDSLIAEIRNHNRDLAEGLAQLAADFKYDEILTRIQAASEN